MLFYARKTLKVKELENPLLLFVTDRRDLDKQLSGIFSNIMAVVKRVESIKDLQETLKTTAVGFELVKNIDKIIFGLYNVMQKESILIFKKRRGKYEI